MSRMAHLEPIASDRGFVSLPPIPGNYGGHALVRESSSAEEPKLCALPTRRKGKV